jgi:lipoyl-dependent peroxiredoxin
MALEKILYTARATTTGGRRDGRSASSDGQLAVTLNAPKELGGSGDGTNPEQLFAAGYSACFLGAMQFVAGTQKLSLSPQTSIVADVGFGPRAGGQKGFNIVVAMQITVPGLERAAAEALVAAAHEVCPYSNATRGNVEVSLTVV